MEYKKDIQKDPLSQPLIVRKGQEYLNENKDETSVRDLYIEFEKSISLRMEKLVTALYMVTDCIEGDEPLKRQMRTLAVDIVSDMHHLRSALSGEKYARMTVAEERLLELVSCLSIAASVGLISGMNYAILKREFLNLREDCEQAKDEVFSVKKEPSLPSFESGIAVFLGQGGARAEAQASERNIKDTLSIKDTQKQSSHNVPYGIKDTPPQKSLAVQGLMPPKKIPSVSSISQRSLSRALDVGLKIERKNKIIKLIREKKEVTIKDISTVISDCSEKTIQRELSTLVAQGVLHKAGEKRWSRYSLKTL